MKQSGRNWLLLEILRAWCFDGPGAGSCGSNPWLTLPLRIIPAPSLSGCAVRQARREQTHKAARLLALSGQGKLFLKWRKQLHATLPPNSRNLQSQRSCGNREETQLSWDALQNIRISRSLQNVGCPRHPVSPGGRGRSSLVTC